MIFVPLDVFIVLELETWWFFASLQLVQHQLLLQVISFTKPHLARADCTEWVWRCSEVVFCVLDGNIIRLKCNAQIYIWKVVLKLSIVFLFTVSICRGYERNSWGIIGLFLLFTVRVQIYGGGGGGVKWAQLSFDVFREKGREWKARESDIGQVDQISASVFVI